MDPIDSTAPQTTTYSSDELNTPRRSQKRTIRSVDDSLVEPESEITGDDRTGDRSGDDRHYDNRTDDDVTGEFFTPRDGDEAHQFQLSIRSGWNNTDNSNTSVNDVSNPLYIDDIGTNSVNNRDNDDAIVVEDYNDDDANNDNNDNANDNDNENAHDTSDVVITSVVPASNRLHSSASTFNRDVRRRLNNGDGIQTGGAGNTNNDDDDIQIINERQLTPPPLPPPSSGPSNPRSIWGQSQRPNHTSSPSLFENPEESDDETTPFRRELLRRIQSFTPSTSENSIFNHFERLFRSFNMLEQRGHEARMRRRRFWEGMNNFNGDDHSESYDPDPVLNVLGFGGLGGAASSFDDDHQERSIMQVIERDNERALDKKLQDENRFNRKALKEKKDQIKREVQGYTSDIKHDENACCELCGITLGEGIPEDFKANSRYNQSLSEYSEQFGVLAPWFCFKSILDVDKELSKRVFLSKCGHLYCGRCIKNIGNRPRRKLKRDEKLLTIENPDISSPSICPSVGCEHKFKAKRSFIELYF